MTVAITYRTEYGNLFWASLIATAVISVAVPLLVAFISVTVALALALVLPAMTAVIAVMGYFTRYTLEKDTLVVNCPNAFNEPPIPYSEVKKIISKTERVYVQGCSTNCVAIYYGKSGYVCISPADREQFIRMLRERCPQAKFESQDKV